MGAGRNKTFGVFTVLFTFPGCSLVSADFSRSGFIAESLSAQSACGETILTDFDEPKD